MNLSLMRTLGLLQLLSLNVEGCTRPASVREGSSEYKCAVEIHLAELSKEVERSCNFSPFCLISSLRIILAFSTNIYLNQTTHRGGHLSTDHSTVETFPKQFSRIATRVERV